MKGDALQGQAGDERETHKEDEAGESEEGDTEEGRPFERIDYCSECWNRITPDFFSYWRTEVPEAEEEDQEPDRSTLAGLWRGFVKQEKEAASDQSGEMVNPSSDLEHGLVYLLTLMLMRKGFLALEREFRKNDQLTIEVRVKGTDDELYEIVEPELDADRTEAVKNELADLLDMEGTEE